MIFRRHLEEAKTMCRSDIGWSKILVQFMAYVAFACPKSKTNPFYIGINNLVLDLISDRRLLLHNQESFNQFNGAVRAFIKNLCIDQRFD